MLGTKAIFWRFQVKDPKELQYLPMLWQWILSAIVGLIGLAVLWSIGSFVFLKLRYRKMTDRERGLFADLDKEQRTPR
jgi:hypothetical protein